MSMAITIFVEDNNNTQSLGRILVSSVSAETLFIMDMIRLRDLLPEAAELTPYHFTYDARWGAHFTTAAGTRYEVHYPVGADGYMEIGFGVYGESGTRDTEITTNEQDVYRVMSTIAAIVQRAVRDRRPSHIIFGASNSDPRRIALYMRYIAPLLRTYEVDRQEAALVVLRRKGLLKRVTQYDWTGIRDK